MVRYHLDSINDNMVLGESIFLPSGKMLLSAGQRIKERYRNRLKELGFQNILIEVEGTEDVDISSVVSEETQQAASSSVQKTTADITRAFERMKRSGNKEVTQIIKENKKHLSNFIASSGLTAAIESLVGEIFNQSSIILNLSALQHTRADLFTHAVNVAIIALCIGRKYRFTYEEMKQLATGAINYDLGLVALPKEIIEKQTGLTDEERKIYRQHPIYGFLLLSDNHAIPPTSAAVALQHHEHQDGTGFPRGIKGENQPPLKDFLRQNQIHRFAEIVAVADVYDMLTSGRMQGGAKVQTQVAIKKLIQLSGKVLNSNIVRTMGKIVPLYPTGARIRVTNAPTSQLIGYCGVVAKDNPSDLEHPEIILYETKKRQKIKPILINTAQHSGFELELFA